jgi:hypothetical protein
MEAARLARVHAVSKFTDADGIPVYDDGKVLNQG